MPIDPPDPDASGDVFDLSDIPNLKDKTGQSGNRTTAADLGVSIEAAQKGQWGKVLPKDQYYNGPTYQLPSDTKDLYQLALCDVKYTANAPAKQYVRRCKKRYEEWVKNRKAIDLGHRVLQAKRVVRNIKETEKKADQEFKEFKEGLAKNLAYSRATLADLYELAGSGFKKVMEAFVNDTVINGEPVKVADFTGAAGKVFGQVARLGTPTTEDAKEEAQSVVFQEALDDIKKKVEMGQVELKPKKGETEH